MSKDFSSELQDVHQLATALGERSLLPEVETPNAPAGSDAAAERTAPLMSFSFISRNLREILGALLVVGGFVVMLIGWLGISIQATVADQMPYLLSGGIVGASLVGVGIFALTTSEHARDRRLIHQVIQRLDNLEPAVANEFDELLNRFEGMSRPRSRKSRASDDDSWPYLRADYKSRPEI